jgi:hypothetical protein
MIMELVTLLYLSIVSLSNFGQTTTDFKGKSMSNGNVAQDTSRIAVFAFDPNQHWMFKNCRPTDLTNSEIDSVEILLAKFIKDYNSIQDRKLQELHKKHPDDKVQSSYYIIELSRYRRQYIATINSQGEKEVWINCFCGNLISDWRKRLVMVQDGGNCYFQIKVNITAKRCYEFMVNGYA